MLIKKNHMKKLLLSVFSVGLVLGASAQFSETFDDQAAFDAWTKIDANNDGANWAFANYGAPSGGVATSESWSQTAGPITPNNYLISPAIDLTTMTGAIALDWDVYSQDQTWPEEYYSVIVAYGNDIAAMNAGDVVFSETMDAYGGYETRTVDLTAYGDSTVYIAFRHYNCNNMFRLNIDNIDVYQNSVIDAAITKINTPGNDNDCALNGTENVSITIFNNGGDAISGFDVSYAINGGTPVVETVNTPITSASSSVFTFSTTADLSTMGEYTIVASAMLTDDSNANNDSKTKKVRNSDAYIEIVATTDNTGGQAWTLTNNSDGSVVASHGSYQWDVTDTTRICMYDSACYSFNYSGAMTGNVEIFYNGSSYYSTGGTSVPAAFTMPAVGSGCPAIDYSAEKITTASIVEAGMVDVKFEFTNNGTETITKVNFDYSLDAGTPTNSVLTGLNITPGSTVELTATTQVNLTIEKAYALLIAVNSANDVVNLDLSDDELNGAITVVAVVPNKIVVLEEGTGTWCGWCPRGTVALWTIANNFPETAIGIAVHNGDPMVVTAYDDGVGPLINASYPGGLVDRIDYMDPGDFVAGYNARKDLIAPVVVDAVADYNANTRNVHIVIDATFIVDKTGDYRINAVVLEDGVTGTSAAYAQANYYSSQSQNQPLTGAGFNWQQEANPVPANKMVYDHVARAILGGFTGTSASIPATITAGTKYTYSYDYTLPAGYNPAKIHVAAMVHGPNNSEILNAKKADVSVSVRSFDDLVSDFDIAPNPANEVLNLRLELKSAANVTMTLMNASGQQVFVNNADLHGGVFVEQINIRNFANGLYLLNLNVDGAVTTKRVVINH
jgi:hypothetical protein